MRPSHAVAAPIPARNVGNTVVAISCDQSLNNDARPMPRTVRFSQRFADIGLWEVPESSAWRRLNQSVRNRKGETKEDGNALGHGHQFPGRVLTVSGWFDRSEGVRDRILDY